MATKGRPVGSTAVHLEVGRKRVFAWALDWPGWCRPGRTEELALEALVPRPCALTTNVHRVGDTPSGFRRVGLG